MGNSQAGAGLCKPVFKVDFTQNVVDRTDGNIRGIVIPEFQSCHSPIPCCSPDNSSALSLGEDNRSSGTRSLLYLSLVICPGTEVANSRPRAIDKHCNNRDLFKDLEKGNYHSFFQICHFPLGCLWPVM